MTTDRDTYYFVVDAVFANDLISRFIVTCELAHGKMSLGFVPIPIFRYAAAAVPLPLKPHGLVQAVRHSSWQCVPL